MNNVIHLDEWKEDHQPHGMFDGGVVGETDPHKVVVAPIEMLRRFVFNNQTVEDIDNIVLRCVTYDWLLDEGFINEDEKVYKDQQ